MSQKKREIEKKIWNVITSVILFIFFYVITFTYTGWDPLNARSWFRNSEPYEYYNPEPILPENEAPDINYPNFLKDTTEKDSIELSGITGTYYNPVPGQCDGSPLVTADGSKIDLEKLKQGQIRWVALSRDLLKRWGGPINHGDTITVHHTNPAITGKWVVHDVMNARFTKMVDFLVALGNKFPGKTRDITIKKEI